jgi:serine/threonine-protein kinase
MKVMHPHLADQQELVMRFREEARTSARLKHPATAPVHEMGYLPDGRPFFTMKLIEGCTLADAIGACFRRPSLAALDALLRQFVIVCAAVEHAHRQGVLHRDLKPSNIMVGAFDEVLVMDWGLSKTLSPSAMPEGPINLAMETTPPLLTQPGLIRGTLAYMPPEQADPASPALDERCDVFALGAVLCEILTGKPPYVSQKPTRQQRQLDLLEQARTNATARAFERLEAIKAPRPLIELVRKCLAASPQDRPPRAELVGKAVEGYLQSVEADKRRTEIQQAEIAATAEETRKRRRVQRVLGGSLIAFLFLGLTSAAVYRWNVSREHAAQRSDLERLLDEAEEFIRRDKLAEAREKLEGARNRARPTAPADVEERIKAVEQVIEFVGALGKCRENSWLITPAGPNLPGSAQEYEKVFRRFGYDLDDLQQFGERTSASAAQAFIVDALDHWAVCAHSDPRSRDRVLQLARGVDPRRWLARVPQFGQLVGRTRRRSHRPG